MSEVTQLVPGLDNCVFTNVTLSSPRIVSETHHTDSMPPDEWHVMPRADHSAQEFNQGIENAILQEIPSSIGKESAFYS